MKRNRQSVKNEKVRVSYMFTEALVILSLTADPEDAVRQADPRGIATSEGAGQCKFGDLMLNVGESVLPDLEANCKCNIPPYVVCTSS
ncbi:hypothetical protein J6590_045028 [Homalodisca vitripennis]|nr:hypothetical protein J6590_045028 [Homalodisca vitripennis]